MVFDKQVENLMKYAVVKAMYYNNEYVTPEHLLSAMCGEREFSNAVTSMGGNVEELEESLDEFFVDILPQKSEEAKKREEKMEVSDALSSVIEYSITSAENSGREKVSMHHMLWGMYKQKESFVVYFLEEQIGDKEEFLFRVQQEMEGIERNSGKTVKQMDQQPVSLEYATNLNETAMQHNPLIGREKELERCIRILCRKDKNNPLFIGEPGVGKTSMAYGLAQKLVSGEVPEQLKEARMYSLDIAAVVAGTQYRGELEKRLKGMMDKIGREKFPIVFLDDIHNLVGAGGFGGTTTDAANLLNPYFESGKIRFIGTTTYEEYKKTLSRNKAMLRRFQNIDLAEPSKEEAVQIVEGLKKSYEQFHGLRYAKEVPAYAVELSSRLIRDRYLPDKAIDLLDEAGAYRKLHPDPEKKRQTVEKPLIEEMIAATCKIPVETAKTDEVEKLKGLREAIVSKIYGQDEAVDKIVNAICMSRAGLLDENKPIAGLLFVGPTGVGKTEVAKVLAAELDVPLLRFDMSEYAEKHTVAKLIGSPAGYVGYDEGGLLTDAVRKTPHCVLLLDEVEKAHPDIYNVLLQVLDYAVLTDNKGQKADFRNVIILMTSNAGARQIGKQQIGFGSASYNSEEMMEEVKRIFSPEFRNRLSSIVMFHGMDRHMAEQIADKKLRELSEKLEKRSVQLTVTDDVKEYLLEKGISREYGARELERVIGNQIKPLFVQELLFGKLKKGGNVRLTMKKDTPAIELLRGKKA